MISILEFFLINQDIILFLYGLVFFMLGFGIIIRTRQSSRLELARSLLHFPMPSISSLQFFSSGSIRVRYPPQL